MIQIISSLRLAFKLARFFCKYKFVGLSEMDEVRGVEGVVPVRRIRIR